MAHPYCDWRRRRRLSVECLEGRDLLAPVRFAMIGDFGNVEPPADWVADTVKSWDPEFIVTVGDNLQHHSVGDDFDLAVGKNWHEFIYNYSGVYGEGSPTPRFFPALGNHDWPALDNYLDFFALPGNERYYDFTWDNLHFFIVNSNQAEPDGATVDSAQAAWLRDGLAASTADFQFVVMHHPPYTSGLPYGNDEDMQWPFAAWGADAVFTGHEHLYERLEVDGIPYFTVGLGGGSAPYAFGDPIPESRFRYRDFYGAMLVTADGPKVTLEFYSARVGDFLPSQLIERFTILTTEASVVGRSLFYNNSVFDGYDAAASQADDGAIAIDKTALLPGNAANFENVSTFTSGINGIIIDIAGLANPSLLSAADFEFRVGRAWDVDEWEIAPAPAEVSVREHGDGVVRATIVWPDGWIRDTWLQVVLKGNSTTGLVEDDTHYWGHATADTGDETIGEGEVVTDFIDAWRVADAAGSIAAIDNPFDVNRDGSVDDADVQLVLVHANGPPGDLDRDGRVGLADLAIVQRNFGALDATAHHGDLTRDGLVTSADIAVLASWFGYETSEVVRSNRLRISGVIDFGVWAVASSPRALAATSDNAREIAVHRSLRREALALASSGVDAAIALFGHHTTSNSNAQEQGTMRLRERSERDLPSDDGRRFGREYLRQLGRFVDQHERKPSRATSRTAFLKPDVEYGALPDD